MYKSIRRLLGAAMVMGLFAAPAAFADGEIPEVNPYSGDKAAIRSGQSWYRGVCAVCHGGRADGQGDMGTGADLRKFSKGFREFVKIVKSGRRVEGRAQFMPAWAGVIKDEDIYKIGAFLETLAVEGANWKEANKQ
jgi:mono/diheme cytochrome c family protein